MYCTGCFRGSEIELIERLQDKDSQTQKEYKAAIAFIKAVYEEKKSVLKKVKAKTKK